MFSQPSRQQFAPMSVPQGSPRQSTGMSGKGGPSRPSSGGMGGKGGGGPQGMGGPTVGQMNQAINQPMRPSMFSAASAGFTQPSLTSSEPQNVNYGSVASGMPNPGSIDRTGTFTSLPYMGSSNAGQAAGGNAQPMWQMLPPLQPSLTSGPQGIAMGNHDPSLNLYRRDLLGESQMPSPQTQMSNFNLRPSVPTPTPRQTIPQGGGPNIPQGLMRRLQSFRGF